MPSKLFKPDKKLIRIVLRDILKCSVRLDRISSPDIARYAQKYNSSTETLAELPVNHLDHTYSLASTNLPTIGTAKPQILQTPQNGWMSETDSSPSSEDHLWFTESDDDDDDEDDDNDDDEMENVYGMNKIDTIAYSITRNGNDEFFAKMDGRTNFVTTHDKGSLEHSILFPSSQTTNGMNSINGKNPFIGNGHDEDDAFLYDVDLSDQSTGLNILSANCDNDGKVWPSIRIFDDVCLKSLSDECYNIHCTFRHNLPVSEMVESRLRTASRHEIEEAQNQLLLRYEPLMSEFFEVFCKHYGREWQLHRENLRQMIRPVSQKPMAAVYMKNILNGFLISEMKYGTCVKQLLIEMDESLDLEHRFTIMWEMIIDSRNEKVNEHLEEFNEVLHSDAMASAAAIKKILNYQIFYDELLDLRDFAINLVKKCRVTTFRQIDTALLKKYIDHVRLFDKKASSAIQQRAEQFGLVLNKL